MYENFIIAEKTADFQELLEKGLSLKEINEALQTNTKITVKFQDFLDKMPVLNGMFREFLEDEVSGMINNYDNFNNAFDNYFFGWIDTEELSDDEANEDYVNFLQYKSDFMTGIESEGFELIK